MPRANASPEAEAALLKCRKAVYQHRIRLKPFLLDFDKLRTGRVEENQFLRALSQAGLHSTLGVQQLPLLAEPFRELDFNGNKGEQLYKVDYESFLADVESVFGERGLEQDPLKEVEPEPRQLINRRRHQEPAKVLSPVQEARLQDLLARLRTACKTNGVQVKAAFHDAAHAPRLPHIVNHVSVTQFQQGLCRLGTPISAPDASLLAEKYSHEDHPDLVNFVLFSSAIEQPSTPGAGPGAGSPAFAPDDTAARAVSV